MKELLSSRSLKLAFEENEKLSKNCFITCNLMTEQFFLFGLFFIQKLKSRLKKQNNVRFQLNNVRFGYFKIKNIADL